MFTPLIEVEKLEAWYGRRRILHDVDFSVNAEFSVSGGAEGVGRTTPRAVVLSISYIIVADMIFSFFLNR